MAQEEPEQVLYAAIMEGLGYSQNRAPFIELAYRAPIKELRERALALPAPERRAAMEGWLLEAAGFRPTEAGPIQPPGPVPCLRWNLFRVRPVNHPQRRIKGVALLLERHLEEGLAAGMVRLIGEGATLLQQGLTVREEGRALIGPDRARELVINAVLPFAVACAGMLPHPVLAEAATGLYHGHPKTTGNEVQREMAELLVPTQWRPTISSARRQQGLLHLQRLLARSDFRAGH